MVLMDKKLFWACFIAAVTLLVAAFAKTGIQPFTAMAVADIEPDVLVLDSGFSPQEVLINEADSIVWKNSRDSAAVIWSPSEKAAFTSPVIFTGKTFSHTFFYAGTYKYADLNTGAEGSVIVTGKAAKSPVNPCNSCPSGCYSSPDDCTRCICQCYKDSDCNDDNDCTIDICSTEPVECVSRQKASCAYGLQCTQEGSEVSIEGKKGVCKNGVWIRRN